MLPLGQVMAPLWTYGELTPLTHVTPLLVV